MVLGPLAVAYEPRQIGPSAWRQPHPGIEDVTGEYPGLDAFGKLDLLLRAEQRSAPDAVEVNADQVRRRALRIEVRLDGSVGLQGNL